MKLLVCGGRDFADKEMAFRALDAVHAKHAVTMVISGGATGGDRMGEDWALLHGIHCAVVQPLWARHGRSAGPLRNRAMLTLRPDAVVAFPGGRGTADMLAAAREAGIPSWAVTTYPPVPTETFLA